MNDSPGSPYPDVEVEGPPQQQIARQLSDIARRLLAPGSLEETLTHIMELTWQTFDGCDQCGVCSTSDARPVWTSSVVGKLDDLQTRLGEGPCLDVLGGQDTVHVEDLHRSELWPQFAPAAVRAGMRSVLAYRLFADDHTLGALQMYSSLPGAFSAHDNAVGLSLAAHAGMALDQAHKHASEREQSDNLHAGLESREIIGQAQGILMEREKITGEQAFQFLRESSQHLNRKLRDVAQDLVDTGIAPVRQSPPTPPN